MFLQCTTSSFELFLGLLTQLHTPRSVFNLYSLFHLFFIHLPRVLAGWQRSCYKPRPPLAQLFAVVQRNKPDLVCGAAKKVSFNSSLILKNPLSFIIATAAAARAAASAPGHKLCETNSFALRPQHKKLYVPAKRLMRWRCLQMTTMR